MISVWFLICEEVRSNEDSPKVTRTPLDLRDLAEADVAKRLAVQELRRRFEEIWRSDQKVFFLGFGKAEVVWAVDLEIPDELSSERPSGFCPTGSIKPGGIYR